jgi:septum site-determining protein MinD
VIIATNKGVPVVLNGDLSVAKVFENVARRIKGETIPLDQDLAQVQERGFLAFFRNLFGRKRS